VSSSLEELPLLFKDYFFATGNLIAVGLGISFG